MKEIDINGTLYYYFSDLRIIENKDTEIILKRVLTPDDPILWVIKNRLFRDLRSSMYNHMNL